MEAIVLCGIQATGKTTFCKERLFSTHMRLNLDMLRTRHREEIFLRACLEAKQPFVVDNTNPTRAERKRYIDAALAAGFKVRGYYFESRVGDALLRNGSRRSEEVVPDLGIKATSARLEIPSMDEGFAELMYVRIGSSGFEVLEWRNEV